MTAGILSERRSVAPFGLFGGGAGAKGVNLLVKASGREVNLGGKATVQLQAGDVLRIATPGAGGYGAAEEVGQQQQQQGNGAHKVLGAAGEAAAVQLEAGSVAEYRRLQESA
jgi:5-oxoprolinase (ATP-hydrolysing)